MHLQRDDDVIDDDGGADAFDLSPLETNNDSVLSFALHQ